MRRDRREQEFSEYADAHALRLRRTAYLIVRDWHTAEDVVQNAPVKLYVAWPRVREDGVDAYARRIVVNEALTLLRRRKPETITDRPPETAVAAAESPVDFGAALALLPAQQRAIVALRYLDDLSVADVAHTLGVADGTVKSQCSCALATLRRVLPRLTLTEENL